MSLHTLGPTGLLVGGLASYVAYKHGPSSDERLQEHVRGIIPSHNQLEEPLPCPNGEKPVRSCPWSLSCTS